MKVHTLAILIALLAASPAQSQTEQELQDLERRVEAIERRLGIQTPGDPPDTAEPISVEWIGRSAQFELTAPYEENRKVVLSKPIPVGAGTYTHYAQIRSEDGPAFVTFPFTCYDRGGKRIGQANRPSTGMHAVHGDWRTAASAIVFPKGTESVRVKAIKRVNGNRLQVKEFALTKGISFPHHPAKKKPFFGTTEIDARGNVKYLGKPIVPFCMFTDNRRADWRDYSRTGWNVAMWCATANACQRAIDADMIPSVSLAWYTYSAWAKATTPERAAKMFRDELLRIKHRDIIPIWFYLDNEHQRSAEALKRIGLVVKACREEMPKVPVYFLNGQYGTASLYAKYGWQDITGTYAGSASTGGQGVASPHNLSNLALLDGQTSPVVLAQINAVGSRDVFEKTLTRCWEQGARGYGFWRNQPMESYAWWKDSKSIIEKFGANR